MVSGSAGRLMVGLGLAWAGANCWRAMFDRIKLIQQRSQLDYGKAMTHY